MKGHGDLVYLAAPYSHKSKFVRELRSLQIAHTAAELMKTGLFIFSPVTHADAIAQIGELPFDFEYWQHHNRLTIDACSRMIVLMLPGWRESIGVAAEIEYAKQKNILVEYMELPAPI